MFSALDNGIFLQGVCVFIIFAIIGFVIKTSEIVSYYFILFLASIVPLCAETLEELAIDERGVGTQAQSIGAVSKIEDGN